MNRFLLIGFINLIVILLLFVYIQYENVYAKKQFLVGVASGTHFGCMTSTLLTLQTVFSIYPSPKLIEMADTSCQDMAKGKVNYNSMNETFKDQINKEFVANADYIKELFDKK